ncbi:MAG TPA: VWA domain-containing protein [Terriglobales bacterium]|nr:VWA domain-containing protein [Terriglobales bacterium]
MALLTQLAFSQSTTPAAARTATAQNAAEIIQHEETTTFKVRVNLVEVRVVVRDAKGHAVDNLKQDDFQLFDNGKPQIISKFSVERATDKPTVHSEPAATVPDETAAPIAVQPVMAKRFVAYLFDDMHLRFADLSQTRNAAVKHLQSLGPEDRAGVFTTSGQGPQDFTTDRAQLIAAMNRIVPRSRESQQYDCPYITYYQADLIINQHDVFMQQRALDDAMKCTLLGGGGGTKLNDPANGPEQKLAMIVNSASRRELEIGDSQVRLVLSTIQGLVRRMAELPGQRTIVLVSPGFFMTGNGDLQWRESEVMERAVHAIAVINTLDARGLYTPMPDVSVTRQPNVSNAGRILQYQIAEQDINQNVLAELADATGGTFFRNNNDFEEGFRRLAAPPEVSYLLAFSPQNLKFDGKYHKLKVTLKSPADGAVQARKGYYAPSAAVDASAQARRAIEDAVFSQKEVREIPLELHTQFFKSDENDAKLSVVARLDVRHVHFRKADGRNNNDVTVVSALFDRNGNFVMGNQKVVQMHLKADTLARLNSGITLKSSFDVKPGSYIVRLVVRDEDGQLAAQNKAVEIP